jgi:predicted metal-dependent hydrolase
VHFPPDIVDYVIAHELAHLRELNHGPHFWAAVGELFPEWERARAWLRSQPDEAQI